MKIAEQIALANPDLYDAYLIAENQAVAIDQNWTGNGYTKYIFDDNSILIQSGEFQYALDASNMQSISGYVTWLSDDIRAEQEEVNRLLDEIVNS